MKTISSFLMSKIKSIVLKSTVIALLVFIPIAGTFAKAKVQSNNIAQFVYTSDLHYGLFRTFHGTSKTSASNVNKFMINQMNTLPSYAFPNDNGLNAGKKVGGIDYMIITGDITNRQQDSIQSATASWAQFSVDYLNGGVTLTNSKNEKVPFLLSCGNHDVSNAIGYPKPMHPLVDATSMVNIYNLSMSPAIPKTNETFNYKTDNMNYTKDIVGVHIMFIRMWPDSANRVWMEKDLAKISKSTPVIIFTHDEPNVEAKHFTNPNGNHDINSHDKFENLLEEKLKDGLTKKAPTTIEQKGFVAFLKAHENIKAYFHGDANSNEFYSYTGPDKDIKLPTFRVDSPIKGLVSGLEATDGKGDESKLSFQVISLDGASKSLTVRECLWNTSGATSPLVWGATSTISLK
ncbi:MAG: metallophosphoesterase [Paludibacter sp.]